MLAKGAFPVRGSIFIEPSQTADLESRRDDIEAGPAPNPMPPGWG
jgi:hypothetical protein